MAGESGFSFRIRMNERDMERILKDIDSLEKKIAVGDENLSIFKKKRDSFRQKAKETEDFLEKDEQKCFDILHVYYDPLASLAEKYVFTDDASLFLQEKGSNGLEIQLDRFPSLTNILSRKLDGSIDKEDVKKITFAGFVGACFDAHDSAVHNAVSGKRVSEHKLDYMLEQTFEFLEPCGITDEEKKKLVEVKDYVAGRISQIDETLEAEWKVKSLGQKISSIEHENERMKNLYQQRKIELENCRKTAKEYMMLLRTEFASLENELSSVGSTLTNHPKYNAIEAAFEVVHAIADKLYNEKHVTNLEALTGIPHRVYDPKDPHNLRVIRNQLIRSITGPDDSDGSYDSKKIDEIVSYSRTGHDPKDVLIGLSCLSEDACALLAKKKQLENEKQKISVFLPLDTKTF
jgi:hypothetical protein